MGYALNGWDNNGSNKTLKPYVNFALEDRTLSAGKSPATGNEIPTQRIIELNGHTITGGTLTANNLVTLTITDSSENKGSFSAGITVNGGATLAVDGVPAGKITASDKTARITLKEGTTFTGYELPTGTTLADWLPDGCCVFDSTSDTVVDALEAGGTGTGTFAVRKIPATITEPESMAGSILYGGDVPENLRPTVTVTDGSSPTLSYSWRYKATDGSVVTLPSTTPKAGESLDAYCVITAKDGETTLWATMVKGYTLTVTKATSTVTTAPTAVTGLTYTGGEQALVTAGTPNGGTMQYSLTENGAYSTEIPTGMDAKAYTVWYKVVGDNNHEDSQSASVSVTIAPKTVTVPTIEIAPGSTYNGTEQKPTITVKDGDTAISDSEYTVSCANNINAGVDTATVTITDQDGGNYTVSGSGKFSIAKANDPSQGNPKIFVANEHAKTYTVDLKSLLPVLDAPRSYGAVTYGVPTVSLNGAYYTDGTKIENGKLKLPINEVESTEEKEIGTITITVSSANYQDFTMTIQVKAMNKIPLEGTPTPSKTAITYGEKLSSIVLSGEMKDGETPVAGTFAWAKPDAAPAAGSYTAEWTFTPADNATYMQAAGTVDITVNKATPAGTPKYTAITTSGKTLADAALAVNGGWPAGTVQWKLPDTTEVKANTAYEWVFTPDDTDNYNLVEGSVTPYPVSSGGGSSGSSGGTATETEKNPDGSTTTTVTDKKTGTVTETTKHTDGSTTVVETKKDGTVTETNKSADGSTGTMVTDKNGDITEVAASVSSNAAKEAAKDGSAVVLPVEVPAAKTTVDAPAVEVSVPKSAGSVKVEIPVEKVTSGTVAVIVKADGTEEIVKTSIPTGDGIRLTVEGDVTVKIVDNAKDFTDTQGHWAEASIDFATSHELFSGTSATTFTPDSAMTRAMLMTVLARFDGEDTTGGSVWYEKSMTWAKENGISDGSNPNGNITREQLATMLWRYAGSPAGDGDLSSFKDSARVNSYAVEALRWAVGEGLISGTDTGMLAPQSNATRAQVATILKRFVESLSK